MLDLSWQNSLIGAVVIKVDWDVGQETLGIVEWLVQLGQAVVNLRSDKAAGPYWIGGELPRMFECAKVPQHCAALVQQVRWLCYAVASLEVFTPGFVGCRWV